ncbi:unnamed protein product [Cuscuta epithymum]|uniref:DUF7787 domain-containing protein n=1 Tax=Cuscuta epithymum TaxID=186058 RepID=A0AAV0CDF3_9ASTE|nr:unnamed protein product [Cuscuta epithymum]
MAESGIGRRARGKLTVDEYLNFIDTNRQLDLTAPQLREIIDMHGFKAMRSASKVRTHAHLPSINSCSVLEAVASMELIQLGRSTLQQEMRGNWNHAAAADMKSVKQDLAALKWEECCVTSLHTTTFSDSHPIPNSNSKKNHRLVTLSRGAPKKRMRCLNNIHTPLNLT